MARGLKLEQNGQKWKRNQLLYTDFIVLTVNLKGNIQMMVIVFDEDMSD